MGTQVIAASIHLGADAAAIAARQRNTGATGVEPHSQNLVGEMVEFLGKRRHHQYDMSDTQPTDPESLLHRVVARNKRILEIVAGPKYLVAKSGRVMKPSHTLDTALERLSFVCQLERHVGGS